LISSTSSEGRGTISRSGGWSSWGSISTSFLLVLVSDEEYFWLAWESCSWSSYLHIVRVLRLLHQDIDDSLLLGLFWENNFSLGLTGGAWGLNENDVHMLVSSTVDSEDLVLDEGWLIWSSVDVDLNN
jgi:hypothetical protein